MKITAIEPTQKGGYTGNNGYVYTYVTTLDDGTIGEVGSKTPNKWNVGDEVEVLSKRDTDYGVRLSIGKPGASQYAGNATGSNRITDDQRQKEINVSWSINCAIELGRQTPDEIKATALNLLQLRSELKELAYGNKPEQQASAPPVTGAPIPVNKPPF